MALDRFPTDDTRKAIAQYRKLADQAKLNAEKVTDDAGRQWFLSLANTMTALADALKEGPRQP